MSNTLKKFETADINEVLEDPTKFGMPSFDDFCKNQDKYMGRDDDVFSETDRGCQQLGRVVKRHIYEIEGYRCKTLEEVERIALDKGIKLRELDYRPQLQANTSGKLDNKVVFVSKAQREKRKLWG
jgi:hypothetical protein